MYGANRQRLLRLPGHSQEKEESLSILFSLAHSYFSGVFNSPENIHPFLLAFALDHTGNFF